MKYSIVIPTYNHCDDLLKPCLETIIKYTSLKDLEVIVVANGCIDNTRDFVESLGHPFKLIWFDEALGYTKATNAGIKAAQGDYVLLLNNDVEILPCDKDSWINHLQAPFNNNPKMAMTGSLSLFDHDIKKYFIVFCCAMIKREIFEKIGLPDEIFSPGYGEDIDFSMRVLDRGYEWYCIDKTESKGGTNVGWFPIWHKGTQTFKDIPEYGNVIVHRNRKILMDRYNSKLPKPQKETNMKYSVIIPTYNHCVDLLKPCVESIFKFTNMADVELIISANGCVDESKLYLDTLKLQFDTLGFSENLKVIWNDKPLGYAKACNEAIKVATTDLIVLLNNDTVLLGQNRGDWLKLLAAPFKQNEKAGISCIVKGPSEPAGHDFAVFFCVMIHRKVFEKIGLLNEEYGVGGGEDTEFCIEAERAGFEVVVATDTRWSTDVGMFTGSFPIYHKGEGTLHDTTLVPNHPEIFLRNSLILARKYNRDWYRWRLSNYWERAVFLKGDPIWPQYPREHNRYVFARDNLVGKKVLEIGCSSGFGTQYLPHDVEYTGVDYDKIIIETAKDQGWGDNFKFVHADINKFDLEQYDTIIAFEVIEHLDNGIEVVERLKKHCKRLFITTPYMEPPGLWGPHHKLHMLNETHFPGMTHYKFIATNGDMADKPHPQPTSNDINLMLCMWDSDSKPARKNVDISFLQEQHKEIYHEIISGNCYDIRTDLVKNKTVIDIGANIGVFSLMSANLGAKKVIAVEPVGSTYKTLCENVARINTGTIVTMNNAISNVPDQIVKIAVTDDSGHNSLYTKADNYESITTTTLGRILQQCEGDDILLKIDCEGAEYDVIMNATSEEFSRIGRIVMEVHVEMHPVHKGFEIITNKLTSHGFRAENLKQMMFWSYDANGNQVDYRTIPIRVEIWTK